MRDVREHRKALIDELHQYVFETLEPLEKKIMAGKLDNIRSKAGIHRAWINQATDNYRHSQVVKKHLEEIPISDLPENNGAKVQILLTGETDVVAD